MSIAHLGIAIKSNISFHIPNNLLVKFHSIPNIENGKIGHDIDNQMITNGFRTNPPKCKWAHNSQ